MELRSAQLPALVGVGGTADVEVKVVNSGWAPPINDYRVDLVLQHASSGEYCVAHVATALPRRWLPRNNSLEGVVGDAPEYAVAGSVLFPATMPIGNYSTFIAISDAAGTLKSSALYVLQRCLVLPRRTHTRWHRVQVSHWGRERWRLV